MIYIISGASRSGKTMIARKIAKKKGIPYLSLDWLVMGFTHGIPDYGLHHMLFPDEIAERLWPFLKPMCENIMSSEDHFIIEGEAIMPKLIVDFLKEHPNKIKICFLGFADISIDQKFKEIKAYYNSGNRDWLTDKSDTYIKDHINNMIHHSRKVKNSCEETHLKYFDTSRNFISTIDEAIEYLITDRKNAKPI